MWVRCAGFQCLPEYDCPAVSMILYRFSACFLDEPDVVLFLGRVRDGPPSGGEAVLSELGGPGGAAAARAAHAGRAAAHHGLPGDARH